MVVEEVLGIHLLESFADFILYTFQCDFSVRAWENVDLLSINNYGRQGPPEQFASFD